MNSKTANSCLLVLLVVAFLWIPLAAHADNETEKDPARDDDEMGTITLDPMEIRGYKEELALRMLKLGFERKPTSRAEDLDKVVCWIDNKVGSHLNYLYCGTNRALLRMNRAGRASLHQLIRAYVSPKIGGPREPMVAGPGMENMIFRSDQPVNKGQMSKLMESLGPSSLNREVVEGVAKGERMPDNLPDDREIQAFVSAYAEVRDIRSEYDPRLEQASGAERRSLQEEADQRMIEAIRDADLTIDRYNEISGLSERYASLRHLLRQQLADN